MLRSLMNFIESPEIAAPSAEQFFHAWVEECQERYVDLFNAWPRGREFTRQIFDEPRSLLAHVGRRLNLRTYCGYYHTDAILYRDADLVPLAPTGQTWVRRVRVAFEHENNFSSGLFQELSHLMILDADLRVLVFYPPNPSELDSELRYLHDVVTGSSRSTQFAMSASILLIAGYQFHNPERIEWQGYVFHGDNWLRLGDGRVTTPPLQARNFLTTPGNMTSDGTTTIEEHV